jgi:hypothetical protein
MMHEELLLNAFFDYDHVAVRAASRRRTTSPHLHTEKLLSER